MRGLPPSRVSSFESSARSARMRPAASCSSRPRSRAGIRRQCRAARRLPRTCAPHVGGRRLRHFVDRFERRRVHDRSGAAARRILPAAVDPQTPHDLCLPQMREGVVASAIHVSADIQ